MRICNEIFHSFKLKQEAINDYETYLFPWRSKNGMEVETGVLFFITWCRIQGLPYNAALWMTQPQDMEHHSGRISFRSGKHTFYFQTEEQRNEFSQWVEKQKNSFFRELPRSSAETFAMVWKAGCGFTEIDKRMIDIRVWIEKNCSGNVYYHQDYFFFSDPLEAVKFKLAWT